MILFSVVKSSIFRRILLFSVFAYLTTFIPLYLYLDLRLKDDRLERDPRADAGGVIDQEIPIPQTFTFGLNANF